MSSDAAAESEAAKVLELFLEAQRAMYRGASAEPLRALMADDVVWHVPGRSAIAGDYYGADEVIGYFLRRRELAGGDLKIVKHAQLAHGDTVVQFADGEARLAGRNERWRTVGVYRAADGKLAEAWLVPLDLDAFDRAWGTSGTTDGSS